MANRDSKWFAATVAAVTVALSAQPASGSTGITVEGVNNYAACNASQLSNQVADASNFLSTMTSGGPVAWYQKNAFYNSDVYDSDFYDPQSTGLWNDYDGSYFDHPYNAISYYSGHGVCKSPNPSIGCTGAASCAQYAATWGIPPGGFTAPAICRRDPGDASGTCSWTWALGPYVCGAADSHGHFVDLGTANHRSNAYVRLGESFYSGNWAGAGTNGGTNLVVFHQSCGAVPDETRFSIMNMPAIAGAHLMATTAVVTGDTAMVANRGSAFATRYLANPYGSVAQAWLDAMPGLSGSTWTNPHTGNTYGGYGGFNGTGAHLIMGNNSTAAAASWQLNNEHWSQLSGDAYDATGWNYWQARWACNYNCSAWTWSLP